MARKNGIGISSATFDELAEEYRRQWRVKLLAADVEGRIRRGEAACECGRSASCALSRAHAIAESLRWGEPTVMYCPRKRLIWAVPLMHNARLLGGLLASAPERHIFATAGGPPRLSLRRAGEDLLQRARHLNVTNAALLNEHRQHQIRERRRAEAIHFAKHAEATNVRAMYLAEEPALLAAIRRDDRGEARAILNRLLAAIHYQAGRRIEVVKSYFLELIVMMARSAVEAGGDAEELLGPKFDAMASLSAITSERQLAAWLHTTLERVMDTIHLQRQPPTEHVIAEALRYMADHLAEPISREDVADAAGLSPSHFSRQFTAHIGRTFTDMLNQMRIDKATGLLVRTDRPLVLIAMDCGFSDQSYFTKVFRRYARTTPGQYRLRHQ
ncbi:MAG: helix-turn-helix domain-containing protein [Planctomycetes bacterium]|jgi:AraC-like DNA-binding protein|nr:helix-turn-helix domain-containing protein [Planctomycetota bacterium]